MSKEQLIENMVAAVMEEFDFDRVHRVMVNLDWKWDICDGEMTITPRDGGGTVVKVTVR